MCALAEAGVPRDDPRLVRAADWLLSKEVRHLGDWAEKVPNTEPAGWYFEFANEFYPDTDDTAQVLLALGHVDHPREADQKAAIDRAIKWEFAMQCRERRLGRFDKDCTKVIFDNIPFSDHNAMIDPPTADITGRMLELLGPSATPGLSPGRAGRALPRPAGAGRHLVRPLGRQLHLRDLAGPAGPGRDRIEDGPCPDVRRAVDWIRRVQNADGGWGETCGTYDDPRDPGNRPEHPLADRLGRPGPPGRRRHRSAAAARGERAPRPPEARWQLGRIDRLGPDRQSLYTASGFPKVFYLAYHLYRQYFPLLALPATGGPWTRLLEPRRISLRHGHSDFPDVDRRDLCAEEQAGRQQALPARAHARASFPLQPGLRRLRQSAIPSPHPEEGADPEQCFAAVEECGARWFRSPAASRCFIPRSSRSSTDWSRARSTFTSAPTL